MPQSSRAQFSANSQTNSISSVTSNWAGNGTYVVGSNTFLDTLQIINSAVLSNGTGVLGYALGGSNNTAIVGGTGSLWKNSTNLFVGFLGTANQLIITNGGRVLDPAGTLGYTNVSASTAWVTGPGSVWSNTLFFYVGYSGSGNQLIITNGGLVWGGDSYVGDDSFASNNIASIIGTGSVWTTTNALHVGFDGSSNAVSILSGGLVQAPSTYLGFDTFSSNNVVVVSGSGSVMSNAFNTFLGLFGPANELVVSNGAFVFDESGVIGLTNSSSANLALVNGPGAIWTNTQEIDVGYEGSFNQLVVTNGGTVFSGNAFIGHNKIGSNNVATVVGAGSLWLGTNFFYSGFIGSSNKLAILDGGVVRTLETRIGFDPTSSNNLGIVSGSGALLSNLNTVVGYGGFASALIVSNNAMVWDSVGFIGYTNQSAQNVATVTGTGSVWVNTNSLEVGNLAASNRLFLIDGGLVNAPSTFIGTGVTGSNNLVIVSGTGSYLSNTFNTYVGLAGSGNGLIISNGGKVFDQAGVLSQTNFNSHNSAVVTGPGSIWSNGLFLAVGYNGPQNQLIVSGGGSVFSGNGFLGLQVSGTSNNTATITDSGSVWSTTNAFFVGDIASSNQFFVLNGGAAYSPSTFVGFNRTSASNLVLVSGAGSILSNTFNMYFGYFGGQNRLVISNGASVFGLTGIFGFTNFSVGNTAVVDGTGSTWTNGLFLELNSAGNQLIVTNGGTVFSGDGYIGAELTAASNTAVVTGSGSQWVLTNDLYVGFQAISNSLTIANGATVIDRAGVVGDFSNGNNNAVLVTGPGSVWSNAFAVDLGSFGIGNAMTVSNGGVVFGSGAIGDASFSSNNSLVVTGSGSMWKNTGTFGFFVGNQSGSNRMQITAGGAVFDGVGVVGYFGGSNNLAVVAGAGSVWNNTNQFYVGYDGYASRLVVSNSGAVFGGTLDTYLGQLLNFGANSNSVLVSGSGSIWSNPANLYIGSGGYGNSLVISNGGVVFNSNAWLGYQVVVNDDSNNIAVVTGTGSIWKNAGTLTIGQGGNNDAFVSNQLFVTSDGRVIASVVDVGSPGSLGNLIRLSNGVIQATSINVGLLNSITGSGTITGNTVNFGTISANVNGGTLTFMNGVINHGFINATGGGIFEVYGLFYNLGTTSFSGGSAIFHGPVLSAQGTTNSWITTSSGSWEQAADWSLGLPSTTNAAVLITNAVSKTITVSSNTFATAPGSVTNFGLRVSGPSGSTNMFLVANTLPGNSFVLVNLTIDTNAVAIITNATLQVGLQSSGTLTINGKVQVTTGGLFDSSNTGTMNVGLAGSAAFSVVGGGTALSAGVVIGSDFLSNSVLVSDPGSVWSNGILQVENGTLIITNGATVISLAGIVGGDDATGTVIDTGTVWITDDLTVGNDESEFNLLTITNGGAVYVQGSSAVVDQFGGGSNQVIVSGNGALLDASPATLYVGLFSFLPDRVDIGPGGTVLASFANLGEGSTATNLINVSGGTLFVTNAFGSTMQIFGGTLALNGGTVTVDDLILTTNLGTVAFSSGTLYSASTQATNGVPFVVGDGTDAANFSLLGGVHSFDSLEIRNAAMLSGCGTVTGSVLVDAGGTVLSDCGTLTFTGIVTNNGTLRAINGSVLETYSNLVNNGTIDIINGGVTNFHGTFINHGTILDASSVKISQVNRSGEDFVAQISSVNGHTYQLQFTPLLTPTNWSNTGPSQPGTGSTLTFTDPSGLTNFPARFYRIDCTAP